MSRPRSVSEFDGRAGRARLSVSKLRRDAKNRMAQQVRSTYRWKRVRAKRLALDDHRCTFVENGLRCGATSGLEVHHIDPLSVTRSNAYDLDRLRTLCRPHHRLVESHDQRQARED